MADNIVQESLALNPKPRGATEPFPFLTRNVPPWVVPGILDADRWRAVVRNQPIAQICRDTIISTIQNTPWRIVSKNPDKPVPQEDIDYYTNLIAEADGGFDVHIDLILQDALDIPFGGMSELGRENDDPEGKVMWVKRIDGGTCIPTFSPDWPVAQTVYAIPPIYFPPHAISRLYYSPRTELMRKGWGMAPPERIYLAMELLFRGDKYYANLLLDTPEAGILDLGDMSQGSAEAWLASWRNLLTGTEAFKVPVLYEHTIQAKFLPFTRSPADISYPLATLRYMQILVAGYGLSLADIGVVEGETGTLAGAIRSERRSFRTGFGVAKTKAIAYFNRMLPKTLRFEWIDKDEELLVAKGRARLANSMALRNLSDSGIILKADAQQQLVADGLLTVPLTLPEEGPTDAEVALQRPKHIAAGVLQKPVKPSEGGEGEINARSWFVPPTGYLTDVRMRRLANIAGHAVGAQVVNARSALKPDEYSLWESEYHRFIQGESTEFDELELVVKARDAATADVLKDLADVKVEIPLDDVKAYYEAIIRSVNQEASEAAYERGSDLIVVPSDVKLSSGGVLSSLENFVREESQKATDELRAIIVRSALGMVINNAWQPPASMYDAINNLANSVGGQVADWVLTSVVSNVVVGSEAPPKLWTGE